MKSGALFSVPDNRQVQNSSNAKQFRLCTKRKNIFTSILQGTGKLFKNYDNISLNFVNSVIVLSLHMIFE
jgi:hypothetical protein